MRSVMNAQQMREVDRYMIETLHIPGLVLMENAAMGVARRVMDDAEPGAVVHVFCGTGNNGGDGLACARILMAHGYDVYVVIVGDPAGYSGDALSNYKMFEHLDERLLRMRRIEDLYGWRVPKAQIILDAIFGTGLSRDVSGVQEEAIEVINKSTAEIISVDIPSGISADNGRVLGCAVCADTTVTFQFPKVGQLLYPGRQHTGKLLVVPIGVDTGVEEVIRPAVRVLESGDPDLRLAARRSDTNKGTYGRLFVVAGSRGMAGAAAMCTRAGYAAGAGLVTAGVPESIVGILQTAAPEATCVPLPEENGQLYGGSRVAVAQAMYRKTAMAIGPGLGLGPGLKDLVTDVVEDDSLCRVVDADALNALDNDLHILAHMKGELVFTPHPAEFARLLGTELSSILEHPLELASAFARKCRVVLVLKGATTIVADTDGSVTMVAAGSPGMAKGGSGDVLTGVIGGFAAQGFSAYEAAVLGVYYCAAAGEKAARTHGEYTMTPADTLAALGDVIQATVTDEPGAWAPAHVPAQIQARAHAAAAAHPAAPVPSRPAAASVAAPAPAAAAAEDQERRSVPRSVAAARFARTPAAKTEKPEPAEAVKTAASEPLPAPEASAEPEAEPAAALPAPEAAAEAEARPEKLQPEETEGERVRARLHDQNGRTIPPTAARQLSDTVPHSRAEAARMEADQANEALTTLRRRAGGDAGQEEEQRAERRSAPARSGSGQMAAEREFRRQATAPQPAVDQNTRVAPAVTPPEKQAAQTSAPMPHTPVGRDEQRHRDELNAEIQRELKKQEQREKPVQRTRRRIG